MIALEVELADPEPWAAQARASPIRCGFYRATYGTSASGAAACRPTGQGNHSDRDCACLFQAA